MIHLNYRTSVLACTLILLGSLLLLFGCESMTEEKMVKAAGLLLNHQLGEDYKVVMNHSWSAPPWVHGAAKAAEIDDDRMPDWATELYDLCVYWEDEYFSRSEIAQRGEDMIRIREGLGWGWILINKDLETHILETGFRWSTTEDGVETESRSRTVIDAWAPPSDL